MEKKENIGPLSPTLFLCKKVRYVVLQKTNEKSHNPSTKDFYFMFLADTCRTRRQKMGCSARVGK
jgi:hypothetical protein